jgi:hypothetical protein
MGYQPGHSTDSHAAYLALDVVCYLLHSGVGSEREQEEKEKGEEGKTSECV